jgi:hypothetical protein
MSVCEKSLARKPPDHMRQTARHLRVLYNSDTNTESSITPCTGLVSNNNDHALSSPIGQHVTALGGINDAPIRIRTTEAAV